MFYFLILTGSGLIFFGMYSRKRHQAAGEKPVPQAVKQKVQEDVSVPADLEALSIRMDQVEKLVFQSLIVHEGRKAVIRKENDEIDEETEDTASGHESEEITAEETHSIRTGYSSLEVIESADRTEPALTEGLPEMNVIALEGRKPGEAAPKKKPMPDNIRAIVDYERQGLSVQEIVNVTRMKKGEVLLLKNLSKHYLK